MTDAERTLRDIRLALAASGRDADVADLSRDVADLSRLAWAGALTRERERCAAVVRRYLLFDSQRAVSWHEVQEAVAAILRGEPGG